MGFSVARCSVSRVGCQEDQRIDYAPVTVGAKSLVLPVRAVISAVTVNVRTYTQLGNERFAGSEVFTKTCNSLFVAEYSGYRLAGATPPAQK